MPSLGVIVAIGASDVPAQIGSEETTTFGNSLTVTVLVTVSNSWSFTLNFNEYSPNEIFPGKFNDTSAGSAVVVHAPEIVFTSTLFLSYNFAT